ncbi:MAG: hypothetical protein F6K58_27955 [Symploca sp. SIO2E9]|nr:hypothetical protein [Symploca sp. SIO2E9]
MLPQKSQVQVISHAGTEARIYPVQQGYRVVVSGTETEFYWHPGIFQSKQELWDWLRPQLEVFIDSGLALGGEWMTLEGDFDDNQMYRKWFINKTAQEWQGYDPLTNRCHTAGSLKALKVKIDRVESEFR